jgi:hypothetical protein
MQAKTKEQYTTAWICEAKGIYSVANDVVARDSNLADQIVGYIEGLTEAIRKAGDLLESEGKFPE